MINLDPNLNATNSLKLIAAVEIAVNIGYPGDRTTRANSTIKKWRTYLMGESDISSDDMGRICREMASILNDQADNLRDESHTTEVER